MSLSLNPRTAEPRYSTLEVVDTDHNAAEPSTNDGSGQLAQTAEHSRGTERHDAINEKVFCDISPVPMNHSSNYDKFLVVPASKSTWGLRRKYLWLLVAVTALVVIGGAIGGGIAASRKGKSNSPDTTTGWPLGTPGSMSASPKGPLARSALAAISWRDTSSPTSHSAVFFQDDKTNAIIQSTWNSDTRTWTTSAVTNNSIDVKAGSPLAAVVIGVENPYKMRLFYLDSTNRIGSMYTNDMDTNDFTGAWRHNSSISYESTVAHPSTKLTALWHNCTVCPQATLLVYQNVDGGLTLRNGTASNTFFYPLHASPSRSSGLSFALYSDNDLFLFYEVEGMSYGGYFLDGLRWTSSGSPEDNGWSTLDVDDSIANFIQAANSTPLAAFTSHAYDLASTPAQIIIYKPPTPGTASDIGGSGGSNETTWQSSTWQLQGNSSIPIATQNSSGSCSGIAANEAGRVYAVVGPDCSEIMEWRLAIDGTWASVGMVNVVLERPSTRDWGETGSAA